MAYTIKSGSMPFPQSIKDLAEYLSVNCNSTLEVYYTQGKDANAYTKEMFNEYKTSQKYKSTYKSTIPMDMIIRDLESKEKTNGNKTLIVGSDLYKAFIDQATKTMRQYVDYFPKVYSGYILEITVSSCNYKDKLKSTLDDLMKKGAVKKVFYQDKITYLHCADSYAIGRILKDIQAKEVKTPVVAKPTTTPTTTSSSSSFKIILSGRLTQEDKDMYKKFQPQIDNLLKYVCYKYNTSVTITDIMRNKEEQAYFMLGSMTPKTDKYPSKDDKKDFTSRNYITVYSTESILPSLITYAFTKHPAALSDFEQSKIENIVLKSKDEKTNRVKLWTEEEQIYCQEFFSALADSIIGDKKLTREEIEYGYTNNSFQEFANWVSTKDFQHLYGENRTRTAIDFTIDNDKLNLQKIVKELNTYQIKLDYSLARDKDVIAEDSHIHAVVQQ